MPIHPFILEPSGLSQSRIHVYVRYDPCGAQAGLLLIRNQYLDEIEIITETTKQRRGRETRIEMKRIFMLNDDAECSTAPDAVETEEGKENSRDVWRARSKRGAI
ncbi:hypothetical protein CVT26_008277 [Gymnopilus dilepis]|uniref:Uncharacterized protein n=1 Tax=Gymnopilus dilepis TaxID=231916 RepID=A0A409WP96_9AGAR|nr:hypothetical protein CVT26_008277 [Gymnopilus dilepis]